MHTRNGKPLTILQDGHPRRLSDGRNAFRKMNAEQRAIFISWMCEEASDQDLKTMVKAASSAMGHETIYQAEAGQRVQRS